MPIGAGRCNCDSSRERPSTSLRARWYRDYLWTEVLGKLDEPCLSPNPRSRKIYDTEKWVGYEVVLDVWEDVFARGIMLVRKRIKPSERRPVVVCQHGRGSVPMDVVENRPKEDYYHQFAARLAVESFHEALKQGNLERARGEFTEAVRLAPESASAHAFFIITVVVLIRGIADLKEMFARLRVSRTLDNFVHKERLDAHS